MNNLAETVRAQGDLAAARGLQEQVLDLYRASLGEQHADTTVSAWNLFLTLWDQEDVGAMRRVLQRDLAWLLDQPSERLDPTQRSIQSHLVQQLRDSSLGEGAETWVNCPVTLRCLRRTLSEPSASGGDAKRKSHDMFGPHRTTQRRGKVSRRSHDLQPGARLGGGHDVGKQAL
jgi:hypothetical protein